MTDWLIDKSALVRVGTSPAVTTWAERIERGLVRISTVTRLEIGFSARTRRELREGLRAPPLASMPVEYLTPAIEDPAVEVQTLLADRGHHRATAIPDLLIAATSMVAFCYHAAMAVNMHIREIDESVHRELVRRADAAGMTLRAYVIDVLQRHTAMPNLDTWLDEVRADAPLPADGPDSVTLIEKGRSDSDAA